MAERRSIITANSAQYLRSRKKVRSEIRGGLPYLEVLRKRLFCGKVEAEGWCFAVPGDVTPGKKEKDMRKCATALALLVLLYVSFCNAASVERISRNEMVVTLIFDISEFSFERIGAYDYVRGEGMVYLPEDGIPGLPWEPLSITIPWDYGLEGIEATCLHEVGLKRVFDIVPTQPPRILGRDAASWVDGRHDIYQRDEFYPDDLVCGVHDGFMGDNRILSLCVSPFRWNAVTKTLILCSRIELRIRLDRSVVERPFRRNVTASHPSLDPVRQSVANPKDVFAFSHHSIDESTPGQAVLEEGDYEYIIITDDSLVSYFDPLIQWKNEKGVPAKCITQEWIDANYTGVDGRERIRNFIIDAYQTWGAVWVLLGGDTMIIPARPVFAMDCEISAYANIIKADLYFSDLDGDWNANGEDPFGEVADSVDMYPDIFLGRAPAENSAEVTVFVDKVLIYEKNPPADYALEMLMPGEILWSDPYTDSGVGLDMIDEDCIPPRYDPILKLYESLGNESRESVLAAMSAGQNYVLHDGHCNEYVMGVGNSYLYHIDGDTLSNGPRNFILNSIGCYPAAIDKDCIAEHFMNNPDGGTVAFVGNCRYGWGSPGNPGFGYSDKFQYEFAKSIFVNDVVHLGVAHGESKAVFVPFAQDENVYRWNEYQVNLLGDPEMPLWTDEPCELNVSAPEEVIASGDQFRVIVEDALGTVEDALVCLKNDDDVYLKGRTDASGAITFSVSTTSPDSLLLTVTGYNNLPLQTRIGVIFDGTVLAWTDCSVVDGGDGKLNPGEAAELAVTIKNFGSQPDSGVWGVLRSNDVLCTVTDSTAYYGYAEAGTEIGGSDGFDVDLDSSLTNGSVLVFDLVLTDTASARWTSKVPMIVAGPVLGISSYGIDDRAGDADWISEPGESVLVTLEIANTGLADGNTYACVTSLDPYLAVDDSDSSAGMIAAGSAGYTLHNLVISPSCPEPYVGMLEVSMTSSFGYASTDTIYFGVGDLNFFDDVESGQGSWVCSGSPDLWHISSYRSHSDSSSWYYGSESTHQYPSNAHGSLASQDFVAGEDNVLSFWFRYKLTTYGSDGAHVILVRNGVPDTLEYIGSGGALGNPTDGILDIFSDWTQWQATLADVMPGDTISFKFDFSSDDSDVSGGVYIDDISFSCKTPVRTGVGDIAADVFPDLRVFPNPAQGDLTIYFAGTSERAILDIYTVEGRLVTSLKKSPDAGSVSWDLRDLAGGRVAPGIYLASIRGSTFFRGRKIVVLR